MTGDRGEVRFIDASGGENVVFKIGTKVVQINGIKCVLDDVSVYEDGAVLVPLSFLQRYAEGITLQYDASKREMVCTRLISGYSTETVSERSHAEFASLTFRVAPGTRAGHIDENTLSEVLLYLTDPKRLAQKAAAAAMAAGTVIY